MGDALTEPGSLPRFAPANDLSLGSLCPLWQSPQKRDLFATEITEGAEGACLVESAVIPCVSAPRSESGSGATPNPPVPHSPLRPSRLRERTSTDPVRLAPTPPLTPSAPENRFAARPTGEAMAPADSPKRVPVEPHRPERKLASMQDRPRYDPVTLARSRRAESRGRSAAPASLPCRGHGLPLGQPLRQQHPQRRPGVHRARGNHRYLGLTPIASFDVSAIKVGRRIPRTSAQSR